MMREMTEQQFREWIAYYQIEPFGTLMTDSEWASWKALYANAHLRKGKRPFRTEKFLLFTGKDKEKDASDIYEGSDYEDL